MINELNFAKYWRSLMMHYIIILLSINFSKFLDKVGSIQLAAVRGLFVSLKHQNDSVVSQGKYPLSRGSQMTCSYVFFSGVGRSLIWGIDNVVDFIQI